MILSIPPDAPWHVHVVANAALIAHIGGGAIGLVAGAAAMVARKGGRTHRLAGKVYVASMLVMALVGAAVAPLLPQRISTVAGVLAAYLVLSGWMAVRRPSLALGLAFLGTALAVGAACLALRFAAVDGQVDDQSIAALYVFGALAAIAAAGDLNLILNRRLLGRARIARHLWRMGIALLLAAGSFFQGQAQVFPAAVREGPLLALPTLAVLVMTVFWLLRVRLARTSSSA